MCMAGALLDCAYAGRVSMGTLWPINGLVDQVGNLDGLVTAEPFQGHYQVVGIT